ncbi:MAG: hypothetical protein ACEQSK_18755, partial [Sphingomonadaceae bacterium]
MRLLLAISAVLTLYVAPADVGRMNQIAWLVFLAYVLHSAALLLAARYLDTPFWHGKVVYWL